MNDLYRCDYRALMTPPAQDMRAVEITLEPMLSRAGVDKGRFPTAAEIAAALGEISKEEVHGLVQVVINKGETERLTLYFTDGILHRDDGGPARIMEEGGLTNFLFFQDGVLHRTDGPAAITFSNTHIDGAWSAPEFAASCDPDAQWGSVRLQFFENGKAGAKCTLLGVTQWYPDEESMYLSAHRVSFTSADRSDFAFMKGNLLLKKVEVPYLKEVWVGGQLEARSFERPQLNWQSMKQNGFAQDVSKKVNEWMDKNMAGMFDPYHPELFTDIIDEWSFLQEFGTV